MLLKFLSCSIMFFAFTVQAITPTLPCSNCSSVQMKRVAETIGRFGSIQKVVIMDYKNEVATKFNVYVSQGSSGGPIIETYTESLSADEKHDVNIIFELRREIVGMLRNAQQMPVYNMEETPTAKTFNTNARRQTPENYGVSASTDSSLFNGELVVRGNPYDFILTSQSRNVLYDYYASRSQGTIDGLIASTLSKVKVPFVKDMDIKIKIKFIDYVDGAEVSTGSTILAPDFTLETFEVLKAEDRDSNTLPPTKTELDGQTFRFLSSETKNAFLGWYSSLPNGANGDSGISCVVTSTATNGANHIVTYKCG